MFLYDTDDCFYSWIVSVVFLHLMTLQPYNWIALAMILLLLSSQLLQYLEKLIDCRLTIKLDLPTILKLFFINSGLF